MTAMAHESCPGYTGAFQALVNDYPGADVYPPAAFRAEWGPIFHRGRLDGSARILVIGQDPAQHEEVSRRILNGTAGRRTQGFLAKLGIDRSYAMINAWLYSAYNQGAAGKLQDAPALVSYRNRWLDALLIGKSVTAVVALGAAADHAWQAWKATQPGPAAHLIYAKIDHPTADSHVTTPTATLLANWNQGLDVLAPNVMPDHPTPLVHYGTAFAPSDLVDIPERDLPPGVPDWMRQAGSWAMRGEAPAGTADPAATLYKRAHIVITVPASALPQP